MKARNQQAASVGVAAAACAACCAGPILGFLGALGIGGAVGLGFSIVAGLVVAVLGVLLVRRRRRLRSAACAAPLSVSMAVPTVRSQA
jgi:hypothetical protein